MGEDCLIVPGDERVYAKAVFPLGGYVYAHRQAYVDLHGAIPSGSDVHHLCGVKRCINAAHLEALPHAEHAHRHRRDCGHDPAELRPVGQRGETRCRVCDREKAREPQRIARKREYLREWRTRRKAVLA